MKRPLSLSILGWFIIIFNAFGMLCAAYIVHGMPLEMDDWSWTSLDPWKLAGLGILCELVLILAGSAILRGRFWGRSLYVGVTILDLVFGVIIQRFFFGLYPSLLTLAPKIAIFAVASFILFRPAARSYFHRS